MSKSITLTLTMAAAAMALAPVTSQAQEVAAAPPGYDVSSASVAYSPVGEAASDADADVRGGNYVAVIVGGAVVATKWCASNSACKTIATAIIKTIARAGGKYVYENSEPALRSKLCGMGYRKYC